MSESVVFRGIHPQPIAGYLAALGTLRICGTQHDARVRGAFTPCGFALTGISEDAFVSLLLDTWRPAPIVSPWNELSGFYASPKGRPAAAAIDTILESRMPRLATLTNVIKLIRGLLAKAGYREAPEGEAKAEFLTALRGVVPDDMVAWLDAVAVVDGADVRMMPVLGSGGNEGVLEYSGLFLRSLVETVLTDRVRSRKLLLGTLFADPVADLLERPGGQFDPGTAGGFNTGPGFQSKNLPNNPWLFLLLIEGALVWTSGLASRQPGANRFVVSPFTVRHRASGYGSAGRNDGNAARAEVWMPIWRRPATFGEVAHFIAEGRVDVRRRNGSPKHAEDSIDFADALASLGVDRGVESFVRYAFMKRRGDSYIALPAGVADVRYRHDAELLRQLDRDLDHLDQFLSRFPSGQGPPAQLAGLRRVIDDARFEAAVTGGPDTMRRLVRAIGVLEQLLARRDPSREPQLRRPLGRLGPEWVAACGDTLEVRLAAALASLATTGGAGPLRAYLAPLDPRDPDQYAPAARALSWTGATVADRIASVLQRRMLDARQRSNVKSDTYRMPTWGSRHVSLDDVASYLVPGLVDDSLLQDLMFGLTWVNHDTAAAPSADRREAPPLARSYALLKLLYLPTGIPVLPAPILIWPDPAIVPLLRCGRLAAAVERATTQLRARGLRVRRVLAEAPSTAGVSQRLAAALLIPVANPAVLVQAALLPTADPEERTDD